MVKAKTEVILEFSVPSATFGILLCGKNWVDQSTIGKFLTFSFSTQKLVTENKLFHIIFSLTGFLSWFIT